MKRYALFVGDEYYPSRAWHDFKNSFDTVEEALEYRSQCRSWDWYQVVDLHTGVIVSD